MGDAPLPLSFSLSEEQEVELNADESPPPRSDWMSRGHRTEVEV